MSHTFRDLRYGVTVADSDHWTAAHLAAAEAQPEGSYDDRVIEQLDTAMRAAGMAFIAANPDLFAVGELA